MVKDFEIKSKLYLTEDLKKMAKKGSKRAKELGIKEDDVSDLVHKYRK